MRLYVVAVLFLFACGGRARGTVVLGAQCQTTDECVPGLICIDSRCAKFDGSMEMPPEQQPDPLPEPEPLPTQFSIAIAPTTVDLVGGDSTTVPLSLTRTQNADGNATYAFAGLPPNVTAAVDATGLVLTSTPGTAGLYDVTVTATINDVAQTDTFALQLLKSVVVILQTVNQTPKQNAKVRINGSWSTTDTTGTTQGLVSAEPYDVVILDSDTTTATAQYETYFIQGLTTSVLALKVHAPLNAPADTFSLTSTSCGTGGGSAALLGFNMSSNDNSAFGSAAGGAECALDVRCDIANAGAAIAGTFFKVAWSGASFALGTTTLSTPSVACATNFNVPTVTPTAIAAVSGTATFDSSDTTWEMNATSSSSVYYVFDGRATNAVQNPTTRSFSFNGPNDALARTRLFLGLNLGGALSSRYYVVATGGAQNTTLQPAPTLGSPADAATGITPSTTFQWEARADHTNMLEAVFTEAGGTRHQYFCYTTAGFCALPDTSSAPSSSAWTTPAGTAGNWRVHQVNVSAPQLVLGNRAAILNTVQTSFSTDLRRMRSVQRTFN